MSAAITGTAQANSRMLTLAGRTREKAEALQVLVSRAESIRTRLIGSMPEGSSDPANPPSEGVVGQMEQTVQEMGNSLSRLEEIISQLEGVC